MSLLANTAVCVLRIAARLQCSRPTFLKVYFGHTKLQSMVPQQLDIPGDNS